MKSFTHFLRITRSHILTLSAVTFLTISNLFSQTLIDGQKIKFTSTQASPGIISEPSFSKVTEGPVVNDGGWNYGMVWADFNNDNFPDLFTTNNDSNTGKNNFLYMNNGDGTFEKVTEGLVVNDGGSSYAATVAEFGYSRQKYLFVANHNENNFLYLCNEEGTFEKITEGVVVTDGGKSVGCSFADYDRDGLLDLYVVNRDQKNFLYKGFGQEYFEKITSGEIANDIANSSGCAWADYDNDKYPDLYVANSGSASCLYHNNQNGTFTKVEEEPFTSDISSCSGASWGDADNDGDLDLFVSTGQLGMYENWFYLNNGDGSFTRITDSPLVNEANWTSGSAWGDYDKDGDLDLAVGGYDGNNLLFNNDGSGNFEKVEDNEFVNDGSYTEGLAWADYDDDGDLDIFTAKNNYFGGNNSLFINEGNNNNWLKIKLIRGSLAWFEYLIGSRIYVYATIYGQQVTQMRELSTQTGGGQGGQNEIIQFFGLGDAAIVDSLVVLWDYDLKYVEGPVGVNQNREVYLEFIGVDELETGLPETIKIYPNPASQQITIETSVENKSDCSISIFDLNGRLINKIYNGILSADQHKLTWDLKTQTGTRVNPGVYFCRYVIDDNVGSKKIIIQ